MPTPMPAPPAQQMLLDPASSWGLRSKILLLWDKAGGDSLGATASLRNPPAATELSAGLSANGSGAQLSLLPRLEGLAGCRQGLDVPSPWARTGDV